MDINEIIETFLQPFAPVELAEEWDNVGLLIGHRNQTVNSIMTCLTITPESVSEAVEKSVDLIISHHPFPFHSTKRLTDDSVVGRLILPLIENRIAVYSPHTAFDSAQRGINQRIAQGIGLNEIQAIKVLDPQSGAGIGRIGTLHSPMLLEKLGETVRDFLNCTNIDLVGPPDKLVRRVAITCGAAGSLFELVVNSRADALILGETNFHTYLDARANDLGLILPGHFATERFACSQLADELSDAFPQLAVFVSQSEKEPQWKLK